MLSDDNRIAVPWEILLVWHGPPLASTFELGWLLQPTLDLFRRYDQDNMEPIRFDKEYGNSPLSAGPGLWVNVLMAQAVLPPEITNGWAATWVGIERHDEQELRNIAVFRNRFVEWCRNAHTQAPTIVFRVEPMG
jgi:hypothetical protein